MVAAFGRIIGMDNQPLQFLRYQFYITIVVLFGGLGLAYIHPETLPDVKTGIGLILAFWFGHSTGAKKTNG